MSRLLNGFAIVLLMFALLAGMANAADVSTGLVAYWPLDGNADDVVGDFDGEPVNDPDWVDGRVGQAVNLDGTQHINVPDFELVTNDITFVAWINGWKAADWAGIVGSRNPLATEMIFGDNDTVHYVWNDNTMWDWADGPVIPQDEWAMVALAIDPDAATAHVYSDAGGLSSSSNVAPHIEQTVGVLNIGWVDCCGGGRYFAGLIDEVMIYGRALSEDDIRQLAMEGPATVEAAGKMTTTWGSMK
jgi:hypothetical protein